MTGVIEAHQPQPAGRSAEEGVRDERTSAAVESRDGGHWRFAARIALTLGIFGLGGYLLRNYLRALIWAVVLAIALWPLFHRIAVRTSGRLRREGLPALFAFGVALIFLVPVASVTVEVLREAHAVANYAKQAEQNGIPVPEAVSRLPAGVARPLTDWWNGNLAHAGWARPLAERFDTASNRELGRTVGRDVVHRVVLLGFALLALFFLLRDGDAVREQCITASRRVLGSRGERLGTQAVASIHGTVNGLVLVGLGEGVVLGVVYQVVGTLHPILFGAFTAIAAMVPFAAAVAVGLAALVTLAAGKTVGAIIIVVAGFVTTFSADHFIRPALIGGATKLPFLWVLLGILAGVETFGLLGLFVGPAVMAVAILLWREIADAEPPA